MAQHIVVREYDPNYPLLFLLQTILSIITCLLVGAFDGPIKFNRVILLFDKIEQYL